MQSQACALCKHVAFHLLLLRLSISTEITQPLCTVCLPTGCGQIAHVEIEPGSKGPFSACLAWRSIILKGRTFSKAWWEVVSWPGLCGRCISPCYRVVLLDMGKVYLGTLGHVGYIGYRKPLWHIQYVCLNVYFMSVSLIYVMEWAYGRFKR